MISIYVLVQPFVPPYTEKFSDLGVLGPSKLIGGYPTSVSTNHTILLYGYVGNYEGSAQFYQILVKLGNQSTQVSNSTFANAPILQTYSSLLQNNQSSIFPINLELSQPGTNQRLIFELWKFAPNQNDFTYTGQWSQVWLNVT